MNHYKFMDKKKGLKIIIACSILAVLVFSYLLYLHYKPTDSKFCNLGEGFNCDIVNKSIYSEIIGIPVSLLGALTFIGVLILSSLSLNNFTSKINSLSVNSELMITTLVVTYILMKGGKK